MVKKLKCPVCGKLLTQTEYDKALGLWKGKQEHIKHLEAEHKKLKEQEKTNKIQLEEERRKLKSQELSFKRKTEKQTKKFRKEQIELRRENRRILAEYSKKSAKKLKDQKTRIENSFARKMRAEIKKGIIAGIEDQKKQLNKQKLELRKSKNKMSQLEKSLKISARKYEQANEEIQRLKAQIEKGITSQIEGLLEEVNLLAKLRKLYPKDKFDHVGKKGDIIQHVREKEKEIGSIVYECKKVKNYSKKHIEQVRTARRLRHADYAILVTNAFPTKKQYYFVERNVLVISPINIEPVTYTLRESLVRIALLKISNRAKEEAVQRVYDYLSSNEYNNKINDAAILLVDLAKDLKTEISSHKRVWKKRYDIYRNLYSDIGLIDYKLKELVQVKFAKKTKMLKGPKEDFVKIEELGR